MYEIIEKSNGTLFRIYETLEQAESFCKKFPGYRYSKVETNQELTENQTMENQPQEEVKLLPPHVEQPAPSGEGTPENSGSSQE